METIQVVLDSKLLARYGSCGAANEIESLRADS